MKERPTLLNDAMVRAVLDGRKTQTRRVAKPVRHPDLGNIYSPGVLEHEPKHVLDRACPFGQPGDRLWVRECWQGPIMDGDEFENEYRDDPVRFQNPQYCIYRADGGSAPEFVDADDNLRCCWRPSIHMPRWADLPPVSRTRC